LTGNIAAVATVTMIKAKLHQRERSPAFAAAAADAAAACLSADESTRRPPHV